MIRLGELLKKQRESQNLSESELANLSGISLQWIQEIENSEVLPSKIQIEKLAAVPKLGLGYDTLHQWKTQELQECQQLLNKTISKSEKWQCPYRRWSCPAPQRETFRQASGCPSRNLSATGRRAQPESVRSA